MDIIGSKIRVLTYYKEWRDSSSNVVASHSKYDDLEVLSIEEVKKYDDINKYQLMMSNGMILNLFKKN